MTTRSATEEEDAELVAIAYDEIPEFSGEHDFKEIVTGIVRAFTSVDKACGVKGIYTDKGVIVASALFTEISMMDVGEVPPNSLGGQFLRAFACAALLMEARAQLDAALDQVTEGEILGTYTAALALADLERVKDDEE
jgi:hypothetical protein